MVLSRHESHETITAATCARCSNPCAASIPKFCAITPTKSSSDLKKVVHLATVLTFCRYSSICTCWDTSLRDSRNLRSVAADLT